MRFRPLMRALRRRRQRGAAPWEAALVPAPIASGLHSGARPSPLLASQRSAMAGIDMKPVVDPPLEGSISALHAPSSPPRARSEPSTASALQTVLWGRRRAAHAAPPTLTAASMIMSAGRSGRSISVQGSCGEDAAAATPPAAAAARRALVGRHGRHCNALRHPSAARRRGVRVHRHDGRAQVPLPAAQAVCAGHPGGCALEGACAAGAGRVRSRRAGTADPLCSSAARPVPTGPSTHPSLHRQAPTSGWATACAAWWAAC